jgi:hypothetical protein
VVYKLTPYQKKLLDPRWQRLRLKILERDNFACQDCGETTVTLHVDHSYYERIEPWEYDQDTLMTLCGPCHTRRGALRRQLSAATVYMAPDDIERLTEVISSGANPAEMFKQVFKDYEDEIRLETEAMEAWAKKRRG